MLELLALIVDDPLDLIPESQYPAMDMSLYRYAKPTTPSPILKNPYHLTDADHNILAPGIYEVRLSEDKTYFTLEQSNKILMIVPVASLEEIKEPPLSPKEEKKKQKQEKKKKKKKYTEKQIREQRMMEEQKLQARLRASIHDSKNGYFVLKYKDAKYKATGYIPY